MTGSSGKSDRPAGSTDRHRLSGERSGLSEAALRDRRTLLARLELGFTDASLFAQALTHRSAGSPHYERLEFLGDSLLNMTIAAELYRLRPDDDEGALSRLRASLVRESTLAEIARDIDLGRCLHLGPGELRSGGFERASILADVIEALIGACLLDAGFDTARSLVQRLFADRLADLPTAESLKDPKTRLQERLQAASLERPEYDIIEQSGAAHERRFTVRCRVAHADIEVAATAGSRRKAEQAAAALMLTRLG